MKLLPSPGFSKSSIATVPCDCCLGHGGDLATCRFWHNAEHVCKKEVARAD